MATLQEMVERYGAEPPAPRPDRQKIPARTVWQRIKGEWPEFRPPPVPRTGLTLEWVWLHVLDDDPAPPSAEELSADASEEDRRYPECHNAMYRRSRPNWLEEKVASYTELARERRWQEVERYLNGGGGLSPKRSEWVLDRADLIRPLVEAAKAEHVACYGEGWLKRAVARIAEQRRS